MPELIGSSWFAREPVFDRTNWDQAVREHNELTERFKDLGTVRVIGSRPLEVDGLCLNRGFVWSADEGTQYVHDKFYVPDEEGYFEARWFNRPNLDFSVSTVGDAVVGVMVCTDVMFNEHARHLGRQGAVIVAVPRTSDPEEQWMIAMQMAAVASGAYVLSSNRVEAGEAGTLFGGPAVVVAPGGRVVAKMSANEPFVTIAIDFGEPTAAKQTYPRYVRE